VLFAISVGPLALAATAQNVTVKRLDGSTITPAEIDVTVTRLMHAAEVPGAAIALFNDEKVAYLKTYGVRDKDQNLPLTPDSVMTAASLSEVALAYMRPPSVLATTNGVLKCAATTATAATAIVPERPGTSRSRD
jgi:hypothetical protein